jgi:hypothetical protein
VVAAIKLHRLTRISFLDAMVGLGGISIVNPF